MTEPTLLASLVQPALELQFRDLARGVVDRHLGPSATGGDPVEDERRERIANGLAADAVERRGHLPVGAYLSVGGNPAALPLEAEALM